MISIIVSSVNEHLLSALKANLAETVGVPYELLSYTSNRQEGICAVYNRGIEDARYPVLCFMHEDIIIRTVSWGSIVTDIFQKNPQVGLIGVAGSCYKSLTPGGWLSRAIGAEYSNLVQGHKYSDKGSVHHYINPGNSTLPRVACIDGLWFCVPKNIALGYKFDGGTFKGFHGYDLDFSLGIGQKHQLVVTYDVLMEHLSEGNFNYAWMQDMLKLHNKWCRYLPVNINNYPLSKVIQIEKATFKYWLNQLESWGVPLAVAGKILLKKGSFIRLSPRLFLSLQNTLLKKVRKNFFNPKPTGGKQQFA